MTETLTRAPSERIHAGGPATTGSNGPPSPPRTLKRRGLSVRFVTRMSDDLSEAVASAARHEGLTAGAYVRRLLLDRVGMQSAEDAKSGRPIRKPDEDVATIAAAVRELASVSTAVGLRDEAAAKAGLAQARSLLIPLVVRRAGP